jgi:hypothetical protein
LKLTRFLAAYATEFSINSSSDGRESVSYHAGGTWTAAAHPVAKAHSVDASSAWYVDEGWDWQEDWWSRCETPGPKVYVGNLPADVSREELDDIFEVYGKVLDVKVMQGRSRRTGQSCAFVVFSRVSEAESCVEAMRDGGIAVRPSEGGLIVKFADDQESQGYGKDAKRDVKSSPKLAPAKEDDQMAKGFQ